jgi:hypothetical protein
VVLTVRVPSEAPADPFTDADACYAGVKQYLASSEARQMSESDLERELQKRGQELLRQLLQAHLEARGPGDAVGPVHDAQGVERPEQRWHERQLETVFGTVEVGRVGYGRAGEDSLHPLDGQLNLPPERYSLEVRRRAAEEAAKSSFDETMHTLQSYTGAEVPKRQVEQLVERAAQDFEAFYEARRGEPAGAAGAAGAASSVLVITVDGKGVVMRKEDLRAATRRAAAKRQHKFRWRLSKGEKRNSKRMATVAAVYTVAPLVRTPEEFLRSLARLDSRDRAQTPRPRPVAKRVWASLEKDPGEVIEEAVLDAKHRDGAHEKSWVAVVDGNLHQLALLKAIAATHAVPVTVILDIIHVAGYVWKAAHAFHREGTPEIEYWALTRLRSILEGKAAAVAAGMRREATVKKLSKDKRVAVDDCADYLQEYAAYLHYDAYLAAGYPIASGVVEGACRSLVRDRMELTGARWRLKGAEAVLKLRALRASGDFDEYWTVHEARERERNHASWYADGVVPPVTSPTPTVVRPRLRRVK